MLRAAWCCWVLGGLACENECGGSHQAWKYLTALWGGGLVEPGLMEWFLSVGEDKAKMLLKQ